MTPESIREARRALGLTYSGMADALRLEPANGAGRVREWEEGKRQITGPASVAIELMLREAGL